MRMTFAPGWTQEIRPEKEREDLMCYISDTYKAVNGFRPRYDHTEDTIEDLREMANRLQDDVVEAGIREEKRALQKKRDKAAHRAAMRYYTNLKPRSNAMEIAMRDAMDKA